LNPRAKEIGLAWVDHVRECVAAGMALELLEDKYKITLLYMQNFREGVWR
jgi:hypothetical protein